MFIIKTNFNGLNIRQCGFKAVICVGKDWKLIQFCVLMRSEFFPQTQ